MQVSPRARIGGLPLVVLDALDQLAHVEGVELDRWAMEDNLLHDLSSPALQLHPLAV